MESVYFIAGIDTGIGKTVATGLVARSLRRRGVDAITVKMVQTGNDGFSEDLEAHRALCGGGRLPGGMGRFHAYEQLSAQVTRWFRHFSVYVGGENLTGFRQKTPIIAADRPWSTDFEPTMVWGPVHGAMFYAGLRLNLGNRL